MGTGTRSPRISPSGSSTPDPAATAEGGPGEVRNGYPLPGPSRRGAGPGRGPMAMAGEVAIGHPAPRSALLLVVRADLTNRRRRVRDLVHRPLSTGDLRFQRRGHALVLAGQFLRLQCPRHRQVPAVQPAAGPLVPGGVQRGLPGAAQPWPGADQVVAARAAAVPYRGHLRRRLGVRPERGLARQRRYRPDRPALADRRGHPGVLRRLPAADVRPDHGAQPLVLPRPGLRRADARRVPAVPARQRRYRPGPSFPAAGRAARSAAGPAGS